MYNILREKLSINPDEWTLEDLSQTDYFNVFAVQFAIRFYEMKWIWEYKYDLNLNQIGSNIRILDYLGTKTKSET